MKGYNICQQTKDLQSNQTNSRKKLASMQAIKLKSTNGKWEDPFNRTWMEW